MKREKLVSILRENLIVLIGTAIVAFGYSAFLIPKEIVVGGITGISLILNDLFVNVDIELFITFLSVFLFFLGFIFLGKDFALKTIVATIIFPLVVYLVDQHHQIRDVVSRLDNFAALFLAALCEGFGLSIVFKSKGSTGGIDILGFLVKKITKIEIYKITLAIDIIILIIGTFVISVDKALLGIVYILLANIVLRRYLSGSESQFLFQIISDKNSEIVSFIHDKLSRGTTIIYARGGYLGEEKEMIEVLVSKYQISQLKNAIREIDPQSFVIVLEAGEVLGNGFKEH